MLTKSGGTVPPSFCGNAVPRRFAFLGSLAGALALLCMTASSSVASAAEDACRQYKGPKNCTPLVQLPARYTPYFYRSPASCGPELQPKPPYAFGVFPYEALAIEFMQLDLFCQTPSICSGSLVPRPDAPFEENNPNVIPKPRFKMTDSFRTSIYNGQETIARSFLWSYTTLPFCLSHEEVDFGMRRERPLVCEPSYTRAAGKEYCLRDADSLFVSVGHPIDPGIGAKLLSETDIDEDVSLPFSRHYYSYGYNAPGWDTVDDDRSHVLGRFWQTPYDSRLYFMTDRSITRAALLNADGTIKYFRADGTEYPHFMNTPVESLVENGDGTWTLTRGDDRIETYDAQGRLVSLWDKTQLQRTLAYDAEGRLKSVTDSRGRVLGFTHVFGLGGDRVVTVTTPAGAQYRYAIDSLDNLRTVTQPDGKVRAYDYDNVAFFNAVTGITDENGSPYESVLYDTTGRATSSWLAPGTQGDTIGRHTIAYTGYRATVTDPLGVQRDIEYVYDGSLIRAGTMSQPCSSCGITRHFQTYDANGYPDVSTDFSGVRTDQDYDARGLEATRRENASLPTYQCPSGASYYASSYGAACTGGSCWGSQPFPGSASAAPLGYPTQYYSCPSAVVSATRTIQTTWHPTFRQPIERTTRNAQNQVETVARWEYNARGQMTAKCDIDPGFPGATCSVSAPPPAGANAQRETSTYCEAGDVSAPGSTCPIEGLLESVTGPAQGAVATYTYYAGDDESGCGTPGGACHRKGDLWKKTNGSGQVTENVAYDKDGRLVRSKDPNGTITDIAYHARGWVLSRTVRANPDGSSSAGDAITAYAYDDVGNTKRVTQPDGTYLDYTYDNAHRLTDVTDHLGNHTHYTLDAAGNRISSP